MLCFNWMPQLPVDTFLHGIYLSPHQEAVCCHSNEAHWQWGSIHCLSQVPYKYCHEYSCCRVSCPNRMWHTRFMWVITAAICTLNGLETLKYGLGSVQYLWLIQGDAYGYVPLCNPHLIHMAWKTPYPYKDGSVKGFKQLPTCGVCGAAGVNASSVVRHHRWANPVISSAQISMTVSIFL